MWSFASVWEHREKERDRGAAEAGDGSPIATILLGQHKQTGFHMYEVMAKITPISHFLQAQKIIFCSATTITIWAWSRVYRVWKGL